MPTNNMGLQGLINDAYAAMGGARAGQSGPMSLVAGSQPGQFGGQMPRNALGQFAAPGQGGSAGAGNG
ncbi:MAG TPA: hypothetical protein PKC18_09610, partial [Lacipirellulaceae bacterium]|nr:hypothetical protein [Lacipirellulaceae bacterium]